jgi:hypothetical protein
LATNSVLTHIKKKKGKKSPPPSSFPQAQTPPEPSKPVRSKIVRAKRRQRIGSPILASMHNSQKWTPTAKKKEKIPPSTVKIHPQPMKAAKLTKSNAALSTARSLAHLTTPT